MNKIISQIIFVLVLITCQVSYAQSTFVARRNDSAATTQILANGQLGALAATDKGELFTQTILRAGTAIIGKVAIDQTTPGTTNGVQVNAALPAGTNLLGKTGIDQTTPGTTNGVVVNAIIAGSSIIGKVGIDQTTPGTTNGVQVNAALPAGTNLIGKTGIDQTTPGTTNKVSIGTDGTVAINTALPAGSNIIGNFRVDQTTPGTTNGVVVNSITAGTNVIGDIRNITTSIVPGTGATNLGKAEDVLAVTGDTLVGIAGVIQTTLTAPAGNGDYAAPALGQYGQSLNTLIYDSSYAKTSQLIHLEDDAAVGGDAGAYILGQRDDSGGGTTGTNGDYAPLLSGDRGAAYVDSVRRKNLVHSNPSILTATSTTLLAANSATRYIAIQNNSAANILINLDGATLTGIIPSNTNPGIVLVPGAMYQTPPNAAPATSNVTVYQTSGGTITTVSVVSQT